MTSGARRKGASDRRSVELVDEESRQRPRYQRAGVAPAPSFRHPDRLYNLGWEWGRLNVLESQLPRDALRKSRGEVLGRTREAEPWLAPASSGLVQKCSGLC
jgi:hypothetical protein